MPAKQQPHVCLFNEIGDGPQAPMLTWRVEFTANMLPQEVEQGDPPGEVEVETDAAELVAVNGVSIHGLQPEAGMIEE